MTDLPADALRVVATLPVKPDSVEAARSALAALATASLANDAGCLQYDVFESGAVPGLFITIEAWASEENLNAHMGAPHIAEAFTVLGGALDGEVGLHPLKPL
ncbi:antibiotic biosynthesis monooxygenase [Nocardioides sp.]|jgi:quinol monooxygenase YgiN|uniref:putative quinol monooxygenase n=1 Tax=Nocardioides sp. TaxID=35761 RepID=UPI0031FF281D|nr:antibiotic biosynthesis monooxygenase [Nocardioides sp.]